MINTLTHKTKTALLLALLSLALIAPLSQPITAHAGGCDSGCGIILPN